FEDDLADPSIADEDEVSQGLEERPFTVDPLVEEGGRKAHGPLHRQPPHVLDLRPRGTKSGRAVGQQSERSEPARLSLGEGRVDGDAGDAEGLAAAGAGELVTRHRSSVPATVARQSTGSAA